MELTSKFWTDSFQRQIAVDWDDFIEAFAMLAEKYSKVLMNQVQKSYLKHILGCLETQEVSIGQFLTFMNRDWAVPSFRTNLFKMKFKPVEIKPNEWKGLVIKVGQNEQKVEYLLKNDKVIEKKPKQLKTSGFLKVGSGPNNDLQLDSKYINTHHFKIIDYKDEYLIRDVSKSNRCKFLLDRQLVLKENMVVQIFPYWLIVRQAPAPADSGNLTTYINLNMAEIQPQDIFKKYNLAQQPFLSSSSLQQHRQNEVQNDYWQEKKVTTPLKSLIIEIRHQLTLLSKEHELSKKTTIGKGRNCNIILEDIRVPIDACQLEPTMGIWLLRPRQNTELSVYLATERQLRFNRQSNPQMVEKDYTLVAVDTRFTFDYETRTQQY